MDKTLTASGTVFNKYLLNERSRERNVGMKEGKKGGRKERRNTVSQVLSNII